MPFRLLLCTDLDRTLLPNGPQAESPGARDKFRQLVDENGVTLVYVTGRDRGLVEQALDEYQLPHPDYVIADVGSTVYQLEQGSWLHWDKWQDEISPDWNGRTHAEIASLLTDLPSLKLQEQAAATSRS